MNQKIAIVGPGATRANDLFEALETRGFGSHAFSRVSKLEDLTEDWHALLVLAGSAFPDDRDEAELREAAGGKPIVIATGQIDMGIVRRAAALGAHDVVLRGDAAAVADAVKSALQERPTHENFTPLVREELLRKVFDLTPNALSVRDVQGRLVIVSQGFADLYGASIEQLADKPLGAVMDPEQAEEEMREDAEVLATQRSHTRDREFSDASGDTRHLHVVKRPIQLGDGKAYVLSVAVDVTRGARTESTLERTNDFLKNVLETISDGVFALDANGRFSLANRRLSQITGYKRHQLTGMLFTRIFTSECEGQVRRDVQMAMTESVSGWQFEAQVAHTSGQHRTISCTLMQMRQGERVGGLVGTLTDVTERKAAERQIEHLAYHDPLTNLPNRRLFADRLTVALAQAQRDGRMTAVLFLDLDRFKSINDLFGHRIGDAVLEELGARFRGCIGSADTVARMGGDEFVFLLPVVDRGDEAIAVARKILTELRRAHAIDDREFVVTGSLGISLYPDHAADSDALIKHADTALFETKRRGGDSYEMFNDSMRARSLDHFILENDLRRGLAQGELVLFYQPIVEMRTERITAMEALVRWNHPTKGLLLPDDFIGLAEETGLIVPLGDWVVREACRQNRDWQRRGIFTLPVTVNVSARQFEGDAIVESVREALAQSGLAPEYLQLEITETALMQSAASSSTAIRALKNIGAGISIDDFGTGYSSLGYLERYPIDSLKIDRSFMPDPGAQRAGIIAGAIISMALTLGIEAIAEGVETESQRDFLLARGCNRAQGFYYWPALAAGSLETLVRTDARDRVFAQKPFEDLAAGSARQLSDA